MRRLVVTPSRLVLKKLFYVTLSLLLLAGLGDLTVSGWDWEFFDYLLAFILWFTTILALTMFWINLQSTRARALSVIVILGLLILVWSELAVDALSKLFRFLTTKI